MARQETLWQVHDSPATSSRLPATVSVNSVVTGFGQVD